MKGASTDKPVVLVTGASAGIGEGIVQRFAAGGFRVVAVARRQERLAELAKALADVADVETVAVDVAQRDAGVRSVDAARKRLGGLACRVTKAGSSTFGAVPEIDKPPLDQTVDPKLKA